jgi:tRNA U55 pseudouridine synthase TruB
MLPIDYTTEETAIRILAASFETNPGVRAFVKEDHRIKSRIFELSKRIKIKYQNGIVEYIF